MGNTNACGALCCRKNMTGDPNACNVGKNDFNYHHLIGKGGFAQVYKVEKDGTFYAMKEMLKARVMAKKSV